MSGHFNRNVEHLEAAAAQAHLEDLKQRAEHRRALRELLARGRRAAYDEAKSKADDAFRSQRYETAVNHYLRLTRTFGPSCVLYSNAAAAMLKCDRPNRFAEAEVMASDALKYDPGNIKARYRRAFARHKQGRYSAAATDLEMLLHVNPSCLDAYRLLQEVDDALMARGEDVEDPPSPDKFADSDEAFPPPNYPALPLPDLDSDTEDSRHKGNSKPCCDYNRNVCVKGPKACAFSHAPDDKALRDDLGRNVCTLNVLGLCRKGIDRCPFSHDKRFLPSGWWDQEDLVAQAREALEHGVRVEHLSILNNTIAGFAAQLGDKFDKHDFIKKYPQAIRFAAAQNAAAGVPLWAPGSVPPKQFPLA